MKHNAPKVLYYLAFIVAIAAFTGILRASAHVGLGEYAGTHAVAFVPEPRSPFTGENVDMKFYLRDLRGNFAEEPFVASVEIQDVSPDGKEKLIFSTLPASVTQGIYTIAYTFSRPGIYRVEYNFWEPNNRDTIRDANFDVEVRDAPTSPYPMLTVSIISVLVGAAAAIGIKKYLL